MTPPATKPTASASVSADAQVTPPAAPAVTTDKKDAAEADPKRWEWRFELGFGPEIQGGRNGGLFGIDNISQWGDYKHFNLGGSLMRDLVGSTVRWRLGGYLGWDSSFGNENTGGSNLHQLTIGPRTEVDWSRVYKGGLGGVWEGPGVVGLYAGLGYGWGTTNVDGGFQLHEQSGLATAVGADINLMRFNVGNVAIDLGPRFETTSIYGSESNSAGWNIGGFLAIRPSTRKMVEIKRETTCEDDVAAIARQEAAIKRLRAENEAITKELGELRFYLEAHPKHPFNQVNMRKALVVGAVAEALNKQKVEPAKIAEFVKEARKTDIAKLGELATSKTGVAASETGTMVSQAETRFPPDYDFWKAPDDPKFELHADTPKNPKNEQCLDVQKYRDQLEDVYGQLRERKGHLTALYKSAVHLAGLSLGAEEIKEILDATIINVDTPSFKTARPNAADMAKLKGGTDVVTISKQVFSVPDFEMQKLDQLADWLNGKGDLPGEERTRLILKEEFGKKGLQVDESPEAKQAIRESHKKISLGIFGHTDSDGSDKANDELSERRANFIREYLISKGVSPDRLVAKGFGEKYPAMPENKGNGQERLIAKGKNRRVEFVPVGISGPITAPASSNPDHVDAKQVPKDEGGTGKEDKKAPAPKAPAPAPAPKAPAPAPKPTGNKADW
ncbi:MAG TPA: OmpA family protein [bacterium]|nr:OmpA family protein [bacterium]